MARFRPVAERQERKGSRIHLGAAGSNERRIGGDVQETDCRGTLRSLWGHEGSPAKWIRAGTICLTCGAWWPEAGYPERPKP